MLSRPHGLRNREHRTLGAEPRLHVTDVHFAKAVAEPVTDNGDPSLVTWKLTARDGRQPLRISLETCRRVDGEGERVKGVEADQNSSNSVGIEGASSPVADSAAAS
jgi:hypothetical protein